MSIDFVHALRGERVVAAERVKIEKELSGVRTPGIGYEKIDRSEKSSFAIEWQGLGYLVESSGIIGQDLLEHRSKQLIFGAKEMLDGSEADTGFLGDSAGAERRTSVSDEQLDGRPEDPGRALFPGLRGGRSQRLLGVSGA